MHQRLQTSEQKVQKITGNIPGVIFQFRINQAGAPFLSYIGSQVEEIFGFVPDPNDPVVSAMARLHEEDRSDFRDSVMTAISQRTAWSYEGRVLMPDGRVKWFLGRASVPAQQGGDLVFDGLFWDITDRKKMEEQLRRGARTCAALP